MSIKCEASKEALHLHQYILYVYIYMAQKLFYHLLDGVTDTLHSTEYQCFLVLIFCHLAKDIRNLMPCTQKMIVWSTGSDHWLS